MKWSIEMISSIKTTVRHFEKAQFVVIWYSRNGENLDADYCYDRDHGIETAKRGLFIDFDKCIAKFPEDVMKHATHYADVHDCLNRSSYFHRIRINKERVITVSRLKEKSS